MKNQTASNVPVRRTNESPFLSLQRNMNRLFEDFSRGFGLDLFQEGWKGVTNMTSLVVPNLDVKETDKEIRILAELPGIDEKDLDISLSKNVLTIKGEKKEEREEKKSDYYLSERSFGQFMRAVELPCEVDANRTEATIRKGVLHLTLPKSESAKKDNHKIQVRAM